MENQYTYYTPDDNDMNLEQEPQKKKGMPKPVKVLCLGLAFGLAASATFQGGNYIGGKLFGTSTQENEKTTATVESAKLTTSSSDTQASDISQIAEATMPSVVSITNLSVQEVQSFFGGVQQQESTSAGSGIIISQNDSELLILTNNHVVDGSDTLTVSFVDEESVQANIKGTDAAKDLAVVAVNLSDIKESTLNEIKVATMGDSSKLKVGETVVAIGNALGYGQSVTAGIVSAKDRSLSGYEGGTLLQTDAAINPGNSGGALLNSNGEVIGVNVAKIADSSVEGVGYAIPISDASDTIQTLMNKETRVKVSAEEQGYLGIKGVDVSESTSQVYNLPKGVYIAEVVDNSGAAKAGISKGSVITAIDGSTVTDNSSLKEQMQYYKVGDTVSVTVQIPNNSGEYEEKTVEVTLGTNS